MWLYDGFLDNNKNTEMKGKVMKVKSIAIGAALILASMADPLLGEEGLPEGSCIYSGDTSRVCTAVAYQVQDLDFFESSFAGVDDLPLDSFAFAWTMNVLQKFRSDPPRGMTISFR